MVETVEHELPFQNHSTLDQASAEKEKKVDNFDAVSHCNDNGSAFKKNMLAFLAELTYSKKVL